MLARLYALAVLAALGASGVGCRTVQCGDGCGRCGSLAFQKYDCSSSACGGGCADPADCATPCGAGFRDACCGGDSCGVPGLKGWLCRHGFGCTGCGEAYWSEWHNDPPCVYEPCDRCGQHTGCRCDAYRAPYRTGHHASTAAPSTRDALELAEGRQTAAEVLR